MPASAAAVLLAAIVVLGSGVLAAVRLPDGSQPERPVAAATLDGRAEAEYVRAFATQDPVAMQRMVELAEDGSPALAYAAHQRAVVAALRGQGVQPQRPVLTIDDDSIRWCTPAGPAPECTVYSAFRVDRSGRLASFQVNGTSIDSRLLPPAERPPTRLDGVSAAVVSAYRSIQSDALIVTLEVRNGGDRAVRVAPGRASYSTPDGRRLPASETVGPPEVAVGGTAALAVAFPPAELGGVLSLEITGSDGRPVGAAVLPVR